MAQRLKKVEFEGKDLVKAWIIVIFAVVMKHAKLLTLVLALLMALPMHAVLKEEDLGKTLSILRKELTKTYLEMEEDMKSSKEMNKRILNNLFSTMSRSNQNALMLYSQKPDYVFDLTYACHEATDQYQDFKKTTLPFRQYVDKMNIEIARYDSLVTSLSKMPTRRLDDSAKVDHDVCLTLAVNIRNNYAETKERMTEYIKYYERAEEQLKTLNDYANVRYNEIQTNIFKNGGEPYWAIIKSMQFQMSKMADSVTDKYTPLEGVSSQWDIKIITFLFLFILIYGTLAIALNIIAIRYVLPKRFRSAEFLKKRTCIILATTTITFALILGVLRATVNQNFLIMASGLLVEYSWLLGVILISLLLRVDGNQIKSAFKIYAPLIVIGFIVITFRIVLIPNDLVNLIFPPILLICALWQWFLIRRHSKKVPKSDMTYTYISLGVFIASVICSWMGYTLLSVQMLIWWIMQLTCILTITCISEWMHKYSESHHVYDQPVSKTWLFRFVYRVLLPVMGLGSIILSIYYAADVFNLSDVVMNIITKRFIDTDSISVSILNIIIVASLWFLFGYINRISLAFLRQHFAEKDPRTADSRSVMGRNVLQVLVWGTWLLVSLAIMKVSNTWLIVISGGLSTGIGFAMKDILENIYYGISLMAGRIKIGDWIECDGTKGKVSSISYTSTMIEAIDGSVIAFQNSQLFTKNYKNLTRNHGYVLSLIPFNVAYGSNVKQVCRVVEDAVVNLKHPNIDKKKKVRAVFTEFGDSSVNFQLLCWVDVVKQIYVVSDIMECIYDTLNKNNIEIPFPQRDIHVKNTPLDNQ